LEKRVFMSKGVQLTIKKMLNYVA